MNYQFLCDYKENLENKINILLKQFYWDKIYIFSAFVSEYGVDKVKEIISHESLNENTEVVIAIGKKTYDINKPIDIQEILDFVKDQNQNKFKTQPISFICPKNDEFHIKAYCFLGRNKKGSQTQIGYSIIGSSNLTKRGFKDEGELCISIDNLELTQKLIDCLSDIYIINNRSYDWDKAIEEYKRQHEKRQEKKYKDKQSRQDQDKVLQLSKENSTPVNQSEPRPGKFIKLGVLTDNDLITKATNLANDSENIDCFYSSPKTLEQAKADFPEGSLCLLSSTENKIFRIVEIMPYLSHQEKTEGCFVTYRENLNYELSDDIGEILEKNEKYKIISDAKDMEDLPYDTLKDFENEVKEYQEYQKMLDDPKYQKWIEKGKEKRQSKIGRLLEEIEEREEIDLITLKKKLKEIRESI
ncbi:phospholipase D family protein [Microcoleus sp. bin38.metabat.b11b12b14.051]|uniref:phospholipase D family protein n=1 Tax=Microcoleus sp. bin38.metabat.b11b12b14.051 TaxID=2742709 RepID=UPI0025E2D3E2|nr:phospholipase D family protein [Microcoleus sp. bin38.metabat.b11b12b14.051]